MTCRAWTVLLSMAVACTADPGTDAPSTDAADTGAPSTSGEPGTFVGLRFEELAAEGDWGMVTDARFIPGTDDLLVLEKSGRVGHLRLQDDGFALLTRRL